MGHIAKNCLKTKEHEQKKEQRTCYLCKKPGHLIADCRFNKNKENKEDKKKPKQEETEGNAFVGEACALKWYKGEEDVVLVGGESLNQSDWCMDNGASEHMCNDRDLFEQYSEITDERQSKNR